MDLNKFDEPFSPEDIEWRIQQSGKTRDGKVWAMVLAYVTNRAIMKRLDDNEEGEMGKDPNSVYEFKRTRSWWKLKDEDSEDGEIIDFEPGDPDSGFANTLGKIVIRLENGVIVRASGIKHKYLDEIWNNKEKYRGRIVEVHCHEKTPDGSLRHPRLKWPRCLRDTEDRIGDKE